VVTEGGQRPDRRNGGQGAGGQGGGMNASMRKKLADMTPEELEEYKGSLDRMTSMIEMVRGRGSEQAAVDMEAGLSALRAALAKNDLPAAQVQKDKLSSLMRSAMGGGRQSGAGGPGGDGAGGGADRPRRGGNGGGEGGGRPNGGN